MEPGGHPDGRDESGARMMVEPDRDPVLVVTELTKIYRRPEADNRGEQALVRAGAGRNPRPARPQWRRQDDNHPDALEHAQADCRPDRLLWPVAGNGP